MIDIKFDGFRPMSQAGLGRMPVSRETAQRFEAFIDLLGRWVKKKNFVSETSFGTVWSRHVADSAQVHLLCPNAVRWLDIGTGAGFPGMVLAMQLADVPSAVIHCIDRDLIKCAFLREAARLTGSPAIIHSAPVQSINRTEIGAVEGVTARALAPLPLVLNLAENWLNEGAVGVFPRGRSIRKQVVGLQSKYSFEFLPSLLDPAAVFLRVR